MKQKRLTRFEALARDLVEGKFGRLFGGRLEPLDVAGRLAQAMEESINADQEHAAFTISLNSEDYQFLTSNNPRLADDISDAAYHIGQTYGEVRIEKPVVKLAADPALRRHQVQIAAQNDPPSLDSKENTTTISSRDGNDRPQEALLRLDAFLIIQGRRHVPLNKPVISLGRRTDNDIVLDLSTVSRRHAQIRWRFGRFVLYDISTRGKTLVNGHPIIEHVLQSGDVIALSDALLIYGEGHEAQAPRPNADHDDITKAFVRPSQT